MNHRVIQRVTLVLCGTIGRRSAGAALAASLLLCGAIGWQFLLQVAPEPAYAWPDGDLSLACSSAELSPARNTARENGDRDLTAASPANVANSTLTLAWSSAENDPTRSVAWGDWDGDGDLDLAVGNDHQLNRVYENEDGSLSLAWLSPMTNSTNSLAWGDWDGDGDLDLAVANSGQPNEVYQNTTVETGGAVSDTNHLVPAWKSSIAESTFSVAWGDWDGDGDLDLAVGNDGQPNRVYKNEGSSLSLAWSSPVTTSTKSVAWGDWDDDGDLDLAAGNSGQPNQVYRNATIETGGAVSDTNRLVPAWESPTSTATDTTFSVAWGDWDGDSDLDLAVGNNGQPNRVYRNNTVETFHAVTDTDRLTWAWDSPETDPDPTESVAWGDLDSDGDLDLAVGNVCSGPTTNPVCVPNRVYENTGVVTDAQRLTWAFDLQADRTHSLAWGDWDRDGDLDLVVGNGWYGCSGAGCLTPEPNRVYENSGDRLGQSRAWESQVANTNDIAWGDWNKDGHLDLVLGNALPWPQQVYENLGNGLSQSPALSFAPDAHPQDVAWGDWDGDGDLDLVVARNRTGGPSRVYKNEGGTLLPEPAWRSPITEPTTCLAWGDWDGDGDLDLAVGNSGWPNRVYENRSVDVPGVIDTNRLVPVWESPVSTAADSTGSVAWGDWDGDGDLDLAVGNYWGQPNRVYENTGAVTDMDRLVPAWESPISTDNTFSVAWGDWDGDGDLDLAVGNGAYSQFNQPSRVYENTGGNLLLAWSSSMADDTQGVAWGDWDGDGDLDLVVANGGWWPNRVYENTAGSLSLAWSGNETTTIAARDVAWADWDGDGDLDLAFGVANGKSYVYNNRSGDILSAVDVPARARISYPAGAAAPFFASATVLEGPTQTVTYTLFDAEGDPAREVRAYYSLDGGSTWQPAQPFTITSAADLAASPTGIDHTYAWDIYRSGIFGASDSVVFRLDVYQGFDGPGPYQYAFRTARTLPFRVRGSQVRVVDEVGNPMPGAVVYHQPNGQTGLFEPYQDDKSRPFRTNLAGYLLGYGEIGMGDELVALVPITHTESYTLYHTSAAPSPTGLNAHSVTTLGVQTLTVSAAHPLYLFNLDLSLEWDARHDDLFLQDLALAVQRASALFYDVTNGQAAIGTVRVYQDKQNWLGADMVVYAQNGIRPRASMGGVVTTLTDDWDREGITITNAYGPGQVRMGPNWDPFGESLAELDTEWQRALAHELAHYLLFLPDNYLGVGPGGAPKTVDCKGSFMTNTYDDDYSELLPRTLWDDAEHQACRDTIAMSTTGRADWETVGRFYKAVFSPTTTFEGPGSLPLDVTHLVEMLPPGTSHVLPALTFDVRAATGELLAVPGAQGILFKTRNTAAPEDDAAISLGSTVADGDRIKVRGAEPGDRLCILGPYDATQDRAYAGCIEHLQATHRAVPVSPVKSWHPNVIVRDVTSRTEVVTSTVLVVTATVAVTDSQPYVQILPAYGSPTATEPVTSPVMAMAPAGTTGTARTFTASITLDQPCFELLVRVWVPGSDPPREAVSPVYLSPPWGGDARAFGGGGNTRAWGANKRQLGAPVASGDGQATIWNVTDLFADTGTASLQAVHNLPGLPSWLVPVGQGYRFVANASFPRAIAFNYLERDVPDGFESALYIYYSPDDGATWTRLPTDRDPGHNQAAAAMPDDPAVGDGQGLYALLSTVDIPAFQPGWNLFGYPLLGSRPVSEALSAIEGVYTTVYGHYAADAADPWKLYDVTVQPPFRTLVNNLHVLSLGHGYWITVSQAVTLSLAPPSGTLSRGQMEETTVPRPPATYYGQVLAGDNWMPAAGMAVQAWMNGHTCGESQTVVLAGGEIGYAVQVLADDGGANAGCGAAGRPVRFTVGGRAMAGPVTWRDHQAWRLDLVPRQNRIYLPGIHK